MRLEVLSYRMLHAEEMMAERGIWRDPGHKSVTRSLHPSVVFKHPTANLEDSVAKE